MSLRSKIVLVLVTVVLAYAAIDNGLLRLFAGHAFGRWEREGAAGDLGRVRERIEDELRDLVGKGRVHARASGLRRFVAGLEPGFAESDLGQGLLENTEVDVFFVVDGGGKVLWGSVLDPGTREPMRLAELPREALSPNNPVLLFREGEERLSGVLMTRKSHPLLFATIPVPAPGPEATQPAANAALLEDAGNGYRRPAHGALVLGRFLGPELKQRIVGESLAKAQAEGELDLRRIELVEAGAPGLPAELAASESGRLFVAGSDGLLHAYERMNALRTELPLVLHVALDRSIDAHRRLSVDYALLSTLIGGLLILFVLLRLLQRIVVAPLSALTSKAVEIGRRDDTTIRVGMQGPDEIGQLAGEFDRMLEKLARSREQVVETARLAGRSEVATGVLHNVGNVLNSVNVAANLATRKAEELSLQDLELLVGVLQSHEQDLAAFVGSDPRGKHLVPFLRELSGSLGTQRQALQSELRALNQGIEHIAELVRAQQSHAGTRGVFELAALDEQVEAALRICQQGLDARGDIRVERDFAELPSVRVDKHKLMEILVNLVHNAVQALAERGGEDLSLLLRTSWRDERTVRIEVRDNGVGIAPENLTRIFNHGFTTKKDGHGFGLHVSANAATEMGAKLHAESDGPGRGAAFYLDIPVETEAALAAA